MKGADVLQFAHPQTDAHPVGGSLYNTFIDYKHFPRGFHGIPHNYWTQIFLPVRRFFKVELYLL